MRSGVQPLGFMRQPGRASFSGTDMRHKTSQTLFNYWNDVRGNRVAPRRFEIQPSRIPGILADTFILERHDAETFRFRLAGTRICDAFGTELRGTNFLDGWPQKDRLILVRHLSVVAQQCAVEIVHMQAGPDTEASIAFEALLLPLLHTRDTVDRVLGSFCPLEHAHWLGHERLAKKGLIGTELVWPEGHPHELDGWVPHPDVVAVARTKRPDCAL